MKLIQFTFLLLILAFCSTPTKEDKTSDEDTETLTYDKLYDLVIQNSGERVEYHGEDFDKSASEFLAISEDGVCGENSCGKALFLENSSENQIDLILHAPFQIDDVTSYVAARYIIEPNQKIPIGCSHLCYDGESYLFERRIVAAKIPGESSEE